MFGHGMLGFLAGVGLPFLVLAVLWQAVRVHVDVGADGIRIRQARSDRFVPFAAIEWIEHPATTSIRFKERGAAVQAWSAFRGLTTCFEAIRMAQAEHQRREQERLQRGEPTAELALPSAKAGEYRQPSYPTEVLLRIAEDPTEKLETRVVAAKALGERPDFYDHARVRGAAASTASEELRMALEEVADAEEAAAPAVAATELRLP